MKQTLRICSIVALGGAIALFALDSDQAVLPAIKIESASVQLTTSYKDIRTVGKGDTLMALLTDAGVTAPTADRAIRAMAKIYKPRRIKPGQRIVLTLQPQSSPNAPPALVSLTFAESVERDIAVHRTETGYKAQAIARPLTRVTAHAAGRINSSLYVAGVEAGLNQSTLAYLIQIFSFDVDFQRDIRRGDQFALMFDEYRDEDGQVAKTGNISVAEMVLSGQKIRLYRYKTKDGLVDFYNENGQSVRKALLRTPIDGARISSGFGRRRHPILGYTRMHKGLDFAARRGTPIYAAGHGVVDFAGLKGSYGKYVRIRHTGAYKTAYAHMHRYGKGVRTGSRVHQGQIIGYVGSTGRSTGPHLHYEVHKNGRQVNPRSIKLPSGRKLKRRELSVFRAHRLALDNQYTALTQTQQIAESPKS
jgi:murein DD-endopeptidase MepM/ murein hydrolase activator NlpD